jgi:Flp pilus assembly pilin Flp
MKKKLQSLRRGLTALHKDEQGADKVEYILIVAAIALPLLAVVVWFRKDIATWVSNAWTTINGDSGVNPGGNTP